MSGPAELERRFYDMLMASQYWPASRMQQHQRTQLSQLLRHAKAQVPFYAHRLDAMFRPDGEIDWDRWNEIPTVTRGDVAESGGAMRSRSLPAGHGRVGLVKSSGSTGVPIETAHNALENLANDGSQLRAYDWNGIDFDKTFLNLTGEDAAVAAWPEGQEQGRWGPAWAPGVGSLYHLNKFTSAEHVADFLISHDFCYLSAIPSRVEVIAEILESRGERVHLDAVFLRGEGLTFNQRQLVDRVFGAACVELYAASETFKMAHTCADGRQHLNAELGLIEIVDDRGHPVTPGDEGRVIATSFYNTAQPLIRYDTGDVAAQGQPCSCGRTLPVMERIVGRHFNLFTMPDGRRFVPLTLEDEMFDLGVGKWQLAQIGPTIAEYRYLLRPDRQVQSVELAATISRGLPDDFDVRLKQLKRFETSPTGKYEVIVNELDLPSSGVHR